MSEQKPFEPTINPMTATVQEMFGQVLQQRIQSGALELAISKYVDKLIDDAASDCLRSYSDVGKALKEQFSKAIMPQLKDISDLPTYHEYVTNRLKLATQQFYDNRLAAVLDKELSELLQEVPEKITLSWLVQQVMKDAKDDEYEGEITLIIDIDNSYGSVWAHIYLDENADTAKRDCKYDLHLSQDKDTLKWSIIGLRVDHRKAGENLSIGKLYNFEKILFNVYAMKGQIDLDHGEFAEDYDTSWCND